ncbi:hypothetical protein HZH68_003366 [Vespula germanica]|uniref:Uncharacterized protein n=1 Tax=Vespula germanica TaxID=30212 RepID=A0A834NP38_VESGE|nr:hypothetical protein HZH68_003366 [Vespula germanica]
MPRSLYPYEAARFLTSFRFPTAALGFDDQPRSSPERCNKPRVFSRELWEQYSKYQTQEYPMYMVAYCRRDSWGFPCEKSAVQTGPMLQVLPCAIVLMLVVHADIAAHSTCYGTHGSSKERMTIHANSSSHDGTCQGTDGEATVITRSCLTSFELPFPKSITVFTGVLSRAYRDSKLTGNVLVSDYLPTLGYPIYVDVI